MTVSTVVDHNDYTGNGVTTSFPYTFRIFKKTDLAVSVVDLSENITVLVLDTDYTVTNAGGYNGGNVVLTAPLANGWQISIARELEPTQETDLRNQGKFFAEVHEDAFDKLTMLIQQVGSMFRLALRKPSSIANWYDALNNYIRNLHDPRDPQDAATKNYVDTTVQSGDSSLNQKIDANFVRTLRVPETSVSMLASAVDRANKVFAWDNAGQPINIPAPSGTATEVFIELAKPTGSGLVGDPLDTTVSNALSRRIYTVETVTQLIAKNFSGVQDGMHVRTYVNGRGVKNVSEWVISSTQDPNTFSLALPAGKFANLVCFPDMNYASFEFGGTDVQNVAAVDEGNRVARAQTHMRSLSFPAGVYNIGAFTLDVDRRAFKFWGAGRDATYLKSTTSGISMHHIGVDPRNRAMDRNHFYQEVGGFTIDGNIDGNGANAASRTVATAHYPKLSYGSVGHRLSNIDINCLVCEFSGLCGWRANGGIYTANSLRIRSNASKISGYIGGHESGVAAAINGPETTLVSAVTAGATQITVSSAAAFSVWDNVVIEGGTLEAPWIKEINGNVITLSDPLQYPHSSGGKVSLSVVGCDYSATTERGQLQIGTCSGVEIHGNYMEETKIYIFGRPVGLVITGNSIVEANPTIHIASVSRTSTIKISSNNTAYPIKLDVADRNGAVNSNLDLYMFPNIEISQSSRGKESILINGIYTVSSLKVDRAYDTTLDDRIMARLEFTGLFAQAAAATTVDAIRFSQIPSWIGYDGYSFDINVTCRRGTSVTTGFLKRAGGVSTDGANHIADTVSLVNSYTQYNSTTGVDVLFGSTASRASITCKGEPTGGQITKFSISGVVTSILS